MSEEPESGRKDGRGRPFGFKLSDDTKDKIRQKRIGQHHTKETKDKISISLSKYFRSQDPLDDNLNRDYKNTEEARKWIDSNTDDINSSEDVLTSRRIIYLSQVEQPFGSDINRVSSHNMTPEFLLLLKEELIEMGMIDEAGLIFDIL